MAVVELPGEGEELVCTMLGPDVGVRVAITVEGDLVRLAYSRPSTSNPTHRRTHLVEEIHRNDGRLSQELARLRPLEG